MEEKAKPKARKQKHPEVIMEEIQLQPHWYLLSFASNFLGSFIIPGILLMLYLLLIFIPNVLEINNFFELITRPLSLIAIGFFPLVVIGLYLLHLFMVGLITRFYWQLTEKRSPSKDGIIPRNIRSKTLNFYHIRSFLIKYPKNIFTKGPFPWLKNWFYNFVGSNVIGKGSTIEEQVCGERFVKMGENCYIGVNSVLTSHLVEGIFGRIPYFQIKVGDNVTMAGLNCIAPGTEVRDNSFLLPLSATAKFGVLRGDNYYFGLPLRKMSRRKIRNYTGITEEEQKKQEERFQAKNNEQGSE